MSENMEHRIDSLEKEAKELALAGVGAADLLKDRAEKLTRELARRGQQVLEAKSVENTPLHRHTVKETAATQSVQEGEMQKTGTVQSAQENEMQKTGTAQPVQGNEMQKTGTAQPVQENEMQKTGITQSAQENEMQKNGTAQAGPEKGGSGQS